MLVALAFDPEPLDPTLDGALDPDALDLEPDAPPLDPGSPDVALDVDRELEPDADVAAAPLTELPPTPRLVLELLVPDIDPAPARGPEEPADVAEDVDSPPVVELPAEPERLPS